MTVNINVWFSFSGWISFSTWYEIVIRETMGSHSMINSLAPGRPGCFFKMAIFNLVLSIGILTSSDDNPLRWMPWDLTDNKSTLVQVMAWCRQATSHYLSQCWPSSMSPYGVTRLQCVKSTLVHVMAWCHQTSHYLSQWCPSSMTPYGDSKGQWVKENCGRCPDAAVHWHYTTPEW